MGSAISTYTCGDDDFFCISHPSRTPTNIPSISPLIYVPNPSEVILPLSFMLEKKIHFFFYKQTKNRNETGSNLSLGTRLTVLSKRLGRKRCCDATPDRCLGGVPSHYLRIVNKMRRLLPKDRGVLVGSQGLKRTKWKNEYAQRRRLRRKINSTSKSEVFPTWAPLPNPKENES